MDIFTILEKINFNKEYFQYFENAFIMRPQLHEKSNITFINLTINNLLPISVYEELVNCFKNSINTEVLVVQDCRNKKDINTSNLLPYFNYFSNYFHYSLNSFIPIIENNQIKISDKSIDLSHIKEILNYVSLKDIEVIYDEIKQDELKVKEVIVKSKQTYIPTGNENEYLEMPINFLQPSPQKIKVTGIVFKQEIQKIKTGRSLQRISITDYNEAITIKRWETKSCPVEELEKIKIGLPITVYGKVEYDTFDRDNEIMSDCIEILDVNPYERKDLYDGEKHIELHVHTKQSEMDGVSTPEELIQQAYKFGSKAIAITDTGSVQAYPKMQEMHKSLDKKYPDNDFKVIYGIEMKCTDDELKIVYNPTNSNIYNSDYIVLDLETTGLSTKYDHIIEFGATYVRNGAVKESKQMFIKPPISVPEFIKKKCNITDEMLENAKTFEEAIEDLLKLIGDNVIVAHNASFDFNFLNDQLIKYGHEPLKNTCVDTLTLAKSLLEDRKYYKLGMVAKNYGVEYLDDEAHRGDYDAEVLAKVWVRMLETIPNYKELDFIQLQKLQPKSIIKKAYPYTVTLLAKNKKGIREIYELVTLSYTKYLNYYSKEGTNKIDNDVYAEPRITKSEINKHRENCFVGSGNIFSEMVEIGLNRNDEALMKCMDFYDYIEIQPLEQYRYFTEDGSSCDENRIKQVVRNIIELATLKGKMIIANNDTSYCNPEEKIGHDVYIMGKRVGGSRHPLYPRGKDLKKYESAPMHLMTTQEMLDSFNFLTNEKAKEIVIDNPLRICEQIEKIYPITTELCTPKIEGCEDELTKIIYTNALNTYGDPLPKIVADRIDKELTSVTSHGFSVQYYIAYLIVKKTNEDGYLVGSRGSVGSSFIANCANITEVNALVPHYLCPNCKHSEFFENHEYADGFDLPEKDCPNCKTKMKRDGHDIPFETFLGFYGDKVPDIDLNFSEESQLKAMLQIRDIFGKDNVFRAGTISTVADKSTYGYIRSYEEETGKSFSKGFEEYISSVCTETKRTTGQHPGGIVVIPKENHVHDFTPIQFPANDPFSTWYTTHFAFKDLHDSILKLDILGHVDPYVVRILQITTGVNPKDINMNDPKVISLFYSPDALGIDNSKGYYHEKTGAAGLPEFGTRNTRNTLELTKPSSFSELVMISGLSHGTDVWAGNARELVQSGEVTLKQVIACRDDIMTFLLSKGLEPKQSFDIMESVRKGRGLKPEWEESMIQHEVPSWYIESCKKIKYMFPKGHAIAYVMMAMRISWWKVYYPAQYYAAYFTCRCDQYDIRTLIQGEDVLYQKLEELRIKQEHGEKLSTKENDLSTVYEIALEMNLRGYHLSNISLEKSEAVQFIVDKDDPKSIIPAFKSVDGLGDNVAKSIVEQRNIKPFISKEDLLKRTSINNTQVAFLENMGVLDKLGDTDQMSLF